MPGTTTPEHEPFEQVTEQAQPSRSVTAMWVVEPNAPPLERPRGFPPAASQLTGRTVAAAIAPRMAMGPVAEVAAVGFFADQLDESITT